MSRILSMNEHYIKNISEDELYDYKNIEKLYKEKIPKDKAKEFIFNFFKK